MKKDAPPRAPALIWDADGVLFETFLPDGDFRWSKNIAQDLGISEAVQTDIFRGDWHDVIRGRLTEQAHLEKVFERHKITLSPASYLAYWLEKDSHINENVARHLSRFESHIGSNQSVLRAQKFEEWFQGRIGSVFASSRIGSMKPEPAYYAFIENALQRPPSELCLIDDTLENVTAAQARGWKAHHFGKTEQLCALEKLEIFLSSLCAENT